MLTAICPDSLVLDAGSGRGTTAVHLAKTLGCRVMGITLEAEGVEAGVELAQQEGVADRVSFLQGDLSGARADIAAFDAAIMECVLSILPDKPAALERLFGVVCPTGYLGITDVTVNGPLPPELQGILAVAGCVADARSLEEYAALISNAGFRVVETTDLQDVLLGTLKDIKGKLMVAQIAIKLGKISLDPELLPQAKAMLASVEDLVRNGTLSYGMVVAQKPAD
jgi:ubiquinone/menaquinone biosynthesis C-methylase UbiE